MQEAVIVSAARTAVGRGKAEGSLASTSPVDVSATVMKAAVSRAGIDASLIEDVVWGCAYPEGTQGLNFARTAVLAADFPVEVPAATINRFCSSGLYTVALAAQGVMSGTVDVALAGGCEMMSQVPMSGHHLRMHPELVESYIGMGFTAERVAERWKVSREDQDRFAYESHRKAAVAQAADAFAGEIVPVDVERVSWEGTKKTVTTASFATDELVRAETTMEKLGSLRAAFKATGTVTAGNASPYSDGAAAVLVMSAAKAKALGLTPLARFVSFAVAGVAPDVMGVGPIKAVPKALAKAGLTLDQIKRVEFNEAFAAQALACIRELGMDESRVNVNGGAIALGHPLGATGAKLTTQLVYGLRKAGGGLGMVTMCVGGGMGAAGIFEVYPA
ncbi:MAG: thiolase family protein [Gemmatimonadaceae bacterium]|nr:thiolase family protein [Gemmatimonadaceae bacterium]